MALFYQFFELLLTLMCLFTTCELSGRLSCEFDDINDRINEFNWYSFPLEMQRLLPIIMANTQQPVDFYCFGSSKCNRDTIKKVSLHILIKYTEMRNFSAEWKSQCFYSSQIFKCAISYFMTLRVFEWNTIAELCFCSSIFPGYLYQHTKA